MDMDQLNDVIVDLFHKIRQAEEKAIITEELNNISNRDLHTIDAIGIDEPRNMTSIAKDLNITVGTLTTAIGQLEKKGYVLRKRGEKDRRVVYISLSAKGKKAYQYHRKFHREMIQELTKELSKEEQEVLVKLLQFFYDYYKEKD